MRARTIFCVSAAVCLLSVMAWLLLKEPKKLEQPLHEHIDQHQHHDENLINFSAEQAQKLQIATEKAGPGQLSLGVNTRGKIIIHPDKIAHIIPKVPGVAQEAFKNIGDLVKEGELLAVLESREMADIKASFLAAKEKESLAHLLFEREKSLYEKKVTAEQDYINAKSTYTEAKIGLQLAKQKLNAYGMTEEEIQELSADRAQDFRLYPIRSPMSGKVIVRHINKGEFIENTATIYELVDLSKVWVEIGIYPKDLAKVKEGQSVDLTLAADGEKVEAKMVFVSPIIQDETITAKAIAELDNENGQFRPGTFVQASIHTGTTVLPIVVSKEAIQEIGGQPVVFVKVDEGFEKRVVELGLSDETQSQIVTGLRAGEEYAVSQTFLLKADLGKAQAEHVH